MFDAYELIKREEIKDINSQGILLKHKKTGAHVALIVNDDNNKVFNIAFRTPPKDSTGVAHIIEHTVLCGSEKFPLKDPFVELAKGSLNTFLNAMTFPDKTMYPVASCNDTDFQNLMEVYLDAVFYPNIYKTEKIFKQEGWHYHMDDADSPITYNGVVYNEMKGVFSSAESVLERTVFNALFPDTPYGVESGGDPDFIPELTYEQYLDFHRTYYHPSNSYIYLYGNIDMEEKLDWIDREYLSRFDKKDIDSEIEFQKPFEKPVNIKGEYPVLDDEPLEDNTYLNLSIVTGDGLDIQTATAFNVLEYVLLDAPGAPLKQALLDAGIGKDVSGCYNDGILQHFFSVDAKYANAGDIDKFEKVITETLEKIAGEGISEKALRAAIHYYEFRFREADFSVYPKGLIYIMNAYDSWLYDENRPFDYLRQIPVYDELKKKIGTGYFENLIKERLLNNNHRITVTLSPAKGLAAKKEKALADKLAEYKASLSEEEINRIVKETRELKLYQEEEDSDEVKDMLPMLTIADIDKKTPIKLVNLEKEVEGIKILHQNYDTRGISYLTLLFGVDDISNEEIRYMSLLKSVLGYVDTKHFAYSDLSNEINSRTGGIACGLQTFTTGDGGSKKFFGVKSKYLNQECSFALSMIDEILFESLIEDDKRLYEIIAGQKAQYQASIPASGHMSAVGRALAGVNELSGWMEETSGISYYRFIETLFAEFEEKKEELKTILKSLAKKIFRKDNIIVSITSSKEGLEELQKNISVIKDKLSDICETGSGYKWEKKEQSEGILTSGQVQFVAQTGNFVRKGYKYTGALRILKTILNYEYLWINLRVKGGAYGCMSGFSRTGDSYLVSYRDPHLKNTLDVYEGLAKFAGEFDADEKTMTKYIIGTVSTLDTPMNPKAKGALALDSYFTKMTEEDYQRERDEILNAKTEDIRALKNLLADTFDKKHICVLGSEAAINRHRELFDHVESFIQG